MKALLFDFDYTLADSSDGIVACVNHALNALKLPEARPSEIRRTIGLSLEVMFDRLTGLDGRLALEFRRRFIERADEIMVPSTHLYPWVNNLIGELAGLGLELGIVSTKRRGRIEAVLAREGLDSAFSIVVGSDMVSAPKPDPEGLLLALETLGARRDQAAYVGDSPADAEAALRARLSFIGVLSGTTPEPELARFPCRAILPDASSIAHVIGGASYEHGTTGPE